MRIGCVLGLVFFGALSYVYHDWLDTVFEPPGSWIGAGVLALLVGLCFGALTNARAALRDWSLVRRARAGTRTLTDGRVGAVIGRVHPRRGKLRSPFLQEECVAYEYEVFRNVSRNQSNGRSTTSKQVDYSGVALVPCFIGTSQGEIELLGFPEMDALPASYPRTHQAYWNARAFLRNCEFAEMAGLVTGFREMYEYLTDNDGEIVKNWRHGQADVWMAGPVGTVNVAESYDDEDAYEEDDDEDEDEGDDDETSQSSVDDASAALGTSTGQGMQLMERSVAPGSRVVVLGVYCEERRGLVPSVGPHGTINRLYPGEPECVQRLFRNLAVRNFLGGVLGLVAVHLAVLFLMHQYQQNPKNARARAQRLVDAVRAKDVEAMEALLSRGVPADASDAGGQTGLMVTDDPEIADLLIRRGADVDARTEDGRTALMEAARMGRVEIMRRLIAAGADLDLRHTEYNTTALMQADHSEQFETAAILREAGAYDDVVTAETGAPLPADGGEPLAVCREYLQAVYAENVQELRRLSSREWPGGFEGIDWNLWRNARPRNPDAFEGYVGDDAATITVSGITAKGYRSTWNYQLVYEDGRWKVLRERWITKPRP